MTDKELSDFLLTWGGGGIPISFPYKGLTYNKPTKIEQIKGNGVHVTFEYRGKPITVALNKEDLTLLPQASTTFKVANQKPILKVGDFIRVVLPKENSQPYITELMKEYDNEIAKITSIDSHGFYKITIEGQDPLKYKWADEWIKKLTAKEYEEEMVIKPFENLVKKAIEKTDNLPERLNEKLREAGQKFMNLNRQYLLSLEAKNKPKNDLIADKKVQFMKDFEFIKKDSRVADFNITPNGVRLTTKPMSFQISTIPLRKKFSFLPAYEVDFDFNHNTIYSKLIGEIPKGFKIHDNHDHPHLNNGSACLGGTISFFSNCMASFDIKSVVMIMLEFFENYNHASPHKKISYFYKDAPICEECNSPCVLSKCEECGNTMTDKVTKEDFILPTNQ